VLAASVGLGGFDKEIVVVAHSPRTVRGLVTARHRRRLEGGRRRGKQKNGCCHD